MFSGYFEVGVEIYFVAFFADVDVRASVMSMLKFILIVAILIGAAYVGKIVVVILVPFLIGFLLSKTSVLMAKPISKLFDKDATKIKPGKRKSTHTKTSLVVYVILNIIVFILIVLTCIGLVYQANSLLVTVVDLSRTIKRDCHAVVRNSLHDCRYHRDIDLKA